MGEKGATPTANQEEPASVLTLLEAADPEDPARVLTLLEVDPTKEDPAVLNAIRYRTINARSRVPQPTPRTHALAFVRLFAPSLARVF